MMTPTLALAFPVEAAMPIVRTLLRSAVEMVEPALLLTLAGGMVLLFRPLLAGSFKAVKLMCRPARRKADAAVTVKKAG